MNKSDLTIFSVKVNYFKPSGKWYTEETISIPAGENEVPS
jgi:hypothetical protein